MINKIPYFFLLLLIMIHDFICADLLKLIIKYTSNDVLINLRETNSKLRKYAIEIIRNKMWMDSFDKSIWSTIINYDYYISEPDYCYLNFTCGCNIHRCKEKQIRLVLIFTNFACLYETVNCNDILFFVGFCSYRCLINSGITSCNYMLNNLSINAFKYSDLLNIRICRIDVISFNEIIDIRKKLKNVLY